MQSVKCKIKNFKGLKNESIIILIICFLFCSMFIGCKKNTGKTDVVFWHAMGDPNDKILNSLILDFETENPNINIKAEYIGNYDVLMQKILASIVAENPPDISQVYENWTTRLKEAGAIVPLQKFINGPDGLSRENIKDIFPIFIKNVSYDGMIWTFPFNKSIYVYYYNAAHFKECGIDKPPATIDEFLETCKKLTKYDSKGNVQRYGFAFKANVDIFSILLYINGGKFFDSKKPVAIFNDETGVKTLQFIVDLVNTHKVAYYTKEHMDADFASGRMSSFIATITHKNYLKPVIKFKLGVAMLFRGKFALSPIAGTNLAIFSKSSHEKQKAGWKFIKWLLTPENSAKWSIGTSYLPVRRSALSVKMMQEHLKEDPECLIGIKSLDIACTDPRPKIWNEVRIFISEAIEKALLGKSTPKQALDEAVTKVNLLLSK
ncbi:MAG: ABC transporter substrate-binding protein [Candidatus Firestonebacteria bacterium]